MKKRSGPVLVSMTISCFVACGGVAHSLGGEEATQPISTTDAATESTGKTTDGAVAQCASCPDISLFGDPIPI